MLPFLLVLAFVGLLFFAGIKFSLYMYRSGTLSVRPLRRIRRSRRSQPLAVPDESEEEPAEEHDEEEYYMKNLVRSLDK